MLSEEIESVTLQFLSRWVAINVAFNIVGSLSVHVQCSLSVACKVQEQIVAVFTIPNISTNMVTHPSYWWMVEALFFAQLDLLGLRSVSKSCRLFFSSTIKALSKKHACIEVQRDLHLIYDCGSKNRTKKGKVRVKSAYEQRAHQAETDPSFCCTKQLGIFLLSPLLL